MNDNPNLSNWIGKLPTLLAGPILRRTDSEQVTIWLVTSHQIELSVCLKPAETNNHASLEPELDRITQGYTQHCFCVGTRAFIHLLHINANDLLQSGKTYQYSVQYQTDDGWQDIVHGDADSLYYPQRKSFSFTYNASLKNVLHGSCRKPHFKGDDALIQVDDLIANSLDGRTAAPDLLIMSGDQIYADDVAGPMLCAIRQLIKLLGLHQETCLLYTSPSPRDKRQSRMPSSA